MNKENLKIQLNKLFKFLLKKSHFKRSSFPNVLMGVRYLKRPPKEYGYTAVTPNVSCEHVAKVVTELKKPYWTTESIRKIYSNEIKAVVETIKRQRPFSPSQQTWRRYLTKLQGRKTLKELNLPGSVLKEIKIVCRRLKRRYKDPPPLAME